MKSNLFCIILACTGITLVGQEETQDILEFFLPQDLLFRNECVNNYNNDNCARIRNAALAHYKYGCAMRYLEKNEEYLVTEYRKEKQPFIPFSSRNPKTRNIQQALITKYVSEKLFADENANELLNAAATTLIIQSTTDRPDVDKEKQLELVGMSIHHALHNQRIEKI